MKSSNCFFLAEYSAKDMPFFSNREAMSSTSCLNVVQTTTFRSPSSSSSSSSASNFSLYPVGRGSVNGSKNRVSEQANNFNIVGKENFISGGSNNVTILGNNNQVLEGASNVAIINSDNQTVTESNTTIIDGKRQWRTVETDVDYSASDRDFVLADSSRAAPPITITLPTASENLWVCVKKVDASASNVDITSGAVGTIDGNGTHTLSSQYDSVELYCDGTNWYIRSDK